MRPSINGVRTHVILPKPQRQMLVALARKTGISVSEHLRRAIDHYLNLCTEKPR
jgi:predicted DNA-binding protein